MSSYSFRGKIAPAVFPRLFAGAVVAIVSFYTVPSSTAVEVSISTLDGSEVKADLTGISEGKAALSDGSSIAVDQIRNLRFSTGASRQKGAEMVFLACGSQLGGSSVHLTEDEDIAIQLASGSALAFPIDAVRGVRLLPERKESLFERNLRVKGDPENDRIYVPQGTELRELTGVIEEFLENNVSLDRDGAPVSLTRDKVYGILFANAVESSTEDLNAVVRTRDGSTLRGKIQGFADNVLQLQMIEATIVNLPANQIETIKVQPPNLIYASDLTPTSSVMQPVLAPARDWQRDKSVSGTPLQLGSRTFEKGIGMAGGTQMTFTNTGSYSTFSALAGIDALRGNRGDCEAIVTGDGQELVRHRLRGGEPPVAINIDVSGSSEIVLSVEPGNDYDLSDHVNWCEAAFLKK